MSIYINLLSKGVPRLWQSSIFDYMHLHTFNFNYNLNGCFTVDKGLIIYRYKKTQPNNVMVLISLRSKCLEDERKNKKIYEEKWTILQLFLLFFKDDSERQKWS